MRNNKRPGRFRVLSIDGGGIRGIIPAVVLSHLEQQTGKRTVDLFDLIVGTSTGAILAAGLTVPNQNGRARYSAQHMLNLYVDRGREIFVRSFGRRMQSHLLEEKYDHRSLVSILEETFGAATLAECIVPVVFPSYDIEERKPYFFKTSKARQQQSRNHYLRDAVRATTAAPTYFEPEALPNPDGDPARRVLIDGGVFANTPALCGYVEAISLGAAPNSIVLLSLGTGKATKKYQYEDAKDWGILHWARPVISVMMDGSQDAVDHHLKYLLPAHGRGRRYFRFDPKLKTGYDALDETTKTNIEALMRRGRSILRKNTAAIQQLISRLDGSPEN